MLIFPLLEENNFVNSLQLALISLSTFKQKLRLQIQQLHAMHRISNLVIYRISEDASPAATLTRALTELYPEVELNASLADLCQAQERFFDLYRQRSADIYALHGYRLIDIDLAKQYDLNRLETAFVSLNSELNPLEEINSYCCSTSMKYIKN